MFYKIEVKDHIRVSPDLFDLKTEEAVTKTIKDMYDGHISKELGVVIDISSINDIKDGTIIPGDGAAYYETFFELLSFKPELQEVVLGRVKDIADFGVFINLGPIEGMIHVSQTMDDFVSFSKDKVLSGKESKRVLKVKDLCRARIIAISFRDVTNPKLGLTMRQPFLGKIEWIEEEFNKGKEEEKGKGKKESKKKK